MAVEISTTLNGQASMWACDCTQNPRYWSNLGLTSNMFTPSSQALPVDNDSASYANVRGTMLMPLPAQAAYWNTPGGGLAFDQNTTMFTSSYKKLTVGGNSRGYAYAQIPGDNDFTPGSGIITEITAVSTPGVIDPTPFLYEFGEFNLLSFVCMLFASKAAVVVFNSSATDSVTVNIRGTLDFGVPVDPQVPEYTEAVSAQPHDVPNMDFLATADVGATPEEAYLAVKSQMIRKLNASNEEACEQCAAVTAGNIPSAPLVMNSAVELVTHGASFVDKVADVIEKAKPILRDVWTAGKTIAGLFL